MFWGGYGLTFTVRRYPSVQHHKLRVNTIIRYSRLHMGCSLKSMGITILQGSWRRHKQNVNTVWYIFDSSYMVILICSQTTFQRFLKVASEAWNWYTFCLATLYIGDNRKVKRRSNFPWVPEGIQCKALIRFLLDNLKTIIIQSFQYYRFWMSHQQMVSRAIVCFVVCTMVIF